MKFPGAAVHYINRKPDKSLGSTTDHAEVTRVTASLHMGLILFFFFKKKMRFRTKWCSRKKANKQTHNGEKKYFVS